MKTYRNIFDPLFDLPFFRLFKKLYFNYKDIWLYLFWGFVNFAIGYVLFLLFYYVFGINEMIAECINWIVSLICGFFLFGIFVFENHNDSIKNEFIKFASGRVFTLIAGEIVVILFSYVFGFEAWATKLINIVITTILNYIVSKVFVYK